MKTKIIKFLICALLSVFMAFSFTACKDDSSTGNNNPDSGTNQGENGGEDGNGETDPVQLIAPVISLNQSTGVITWNAVLNANYYEVYEGETVVAKQTATSYTIKKTAVGSYTYSVKAFSVLSSYTQSELSNTVTYIVEPKVEPAEPLATPVITLNENEITWTAIAHATAYEIYENGEKLTQVTTTSYTITRTLAGEYVYKIRAISSDTVHYEPSAFSNTETYTVQVRALGFQVNVTVPSGYSAPVQVALYKDGEETPVETKPVTITGTQGSVEFDQTNEYSYTASVVSVATGYKATSVRLSASNNVGEIMIISLSGSKVFNVGSNTFKVNNNDQAGADQIYYFLPENSGVYTLDASLESKGMNISVDRRVYIDTAGELNICSFRAEAGTLVEITVVGFEVGTFSFKIVEGEVRQDLRIGIGYGNRANYIFGDCTRTLEVSTPDYYVFEFGLMSLAGRTITLTIDGKDYVFGGYDEETTDVENWLVIPLNEGTHEVTITTTGINPDDEFGYCVFFIYQGEERRSVN